MGCLAGWLLLTLMLLVGVMGGQKIVSDKAACKFPALYNFGDSNSDTGGGSAAFQPIPWPYGYTFFKKPAGRDSDGRVLVDFIGTFHTLLLSYLCDYSLALLYHVIMC